MSCPATGLIIKAPSQILNSLCLLRGNLHAGKFFFPELLPRENIYLPLSFKYGRNYIIWQSKQIFLVTLGGIKGDCLEWSTILGVCLEHGWGLEVCLEWGWGYKLCLEWSMGLSCVWNGVRGLKPPSEHVYQFYESVVPGVPQHRDMILKSKYGT